MTAFFKAFIVGTVGLVLAILFGVQLGQGAWGIPLALTVALILTALYLAFFRSIRLEALVLGSLIFGYLVGNRGFAQISLTSGSPLFLGELGMLTCLGLMLVRSAITREPVWPKSPLSWPILAFLLAGGLRLYFDVGANVNHVSAVTAVRDSAAVYYAVFFFIAAQLARRDTSRRCLEACVLAGCIALIPAFALQQVFPEAVARLTLRGVPVILHKNDLATSYLAFASVLFYVRSFRAKAHLFWKILSAVALILMLAVATRAAIFGFLCATLLLFVARQGRFVLFQAAIAITALIIVGLFQAADLRGDSHFAALADKVESIADVGRTRSYRSEVGQVSADNNQFRLVWWRNVIDDTLDNAPLFGLGFGTDLAKGFVREYFANRYVGFEARSPHSIWVTIFGRMGFVGLFSLLAIMILVVREAFRAARSAARDPSLLHPLGRWCICIVLAASASFGVVLEGPMGAIIFWSALGLAVGETRERTPDAVRRAVTTRPPAREPALIG